MRAILAVTVNRSNRFFLFTILWDASTRTASPSGDRGTPCAYIRGLRIHLDLILPTTGDWKVRTTEELEAAIKESMKVAPTRNAWIHESLEDEVRRVSEEGTTAAKGPRAIGLGNLSPHQKGTS